MITPLKHNDRCGTYPTASPTSKTDRMPAIASRREQQDFGFIEDYQDHEPVPCWPIDPPPHPWHLIIVSALAGASLGALFVLAVL